MSVIIELVPTSKSPPRCGAVSSATLDIALDVARPDTTTLLATFFNAPSSLSMLRMYQRYQ